MIALLLALTVSANQGSAVQLTIPNEPGVKSVAITWSNKKVPAFRVEDQWTAVLGIDLDSKPGKHTADILFTMQDGHLARREAIIQVTSKKYPTTQLEVDDRYVELSKPDLERANRESKETEGIFATITNEMLWTEPFTVPIPGENGTNFGHRRIFNGQPRAPHAGADLRAKTGTPIHATNH